MALALAQAMDVVMNKLCLPSTGAKRGCAAYAAMMLISGQVGFELRLVDKAWLEATLMALFEKSRVIELHGKALSTDKHSGDGLA